MNDRSAPDKCHDAIIDAATLAGEYGRIRQENDILRAQLEEAVRAQSRVAEQLAQLELQARQPGPQEAVERQLRDWGLTLPRGQGPMSPAQGPHVLGQGWSEVVLESIHAGVLIVDASTHRVVHVNAAGARLVGLPQEQIVGQVCHQFLCPAEMGQCPITDLKQCVDNSERVLAKADGRSVPVVKSVTCVDIQGQTYLIESFVEVSAYKQDHTRQAGLLARLEDANRELTEFAYVISHDLRAPLRGIKTLAGWIVSDYADKLDQEGQGQLGLLMSRIDRMENLISGILQYSRVGQSPAGNDPVNLNELVPGIIDMIAVPAHIIVSIDDELPVIQCESTRVQQVFQNLIGNAVKYMDKPQGQVRVGCRDCGDSWQFSVSDNGPGIEEKFFQKIFKVFQTLAPKDEKDSTGIGLAVVKKIVTLYGGRVWVESKVGEGSIFYFTMPKEPQAAEVGTIKLPAGEPVGPAEV